MILEEALKSKKLTNCIIFVIAQLSFWYPGLAKVIPGILFRTWNALLMLSVVFLIGLYLINKRIPNIVTMMLFILEGWTYLSTYINNGEINIVSLSRKMAIFLLVDFFSDEFESIVSIIMIVFEIMIYYNLYTCIITGPDLYGAYYGALGYDNGFTIYLLAAFFWGILYQHITGNKFRALLLIFAVHATAFYTWIGTGIIALLVVDFLIIAYYFIGFRITLLKTYMIYVIAEIAIVLVQVQTWFSFIIVDLLHKDITFTGRTAIWDHALKLIPKKLIYGYGVMTQEKEVLLLGDIYSHNGLVEQVLVGGLGYWILFLLLIFIVSTEVEMCEQNSLVPCMIFIMASFFVAAITENTFNYILNLLLSIMFIFPGYLNTVSRQPQNDLERNETDEK